MGYAEASGLPAITGLYATIVPLLVYAIVGPSRILVLGPDSSLAPIIAVTVVSLAAGDPEKAIALASATALMTGALLVLAGLLHLGYLTDLLSLPIRYGYLNGIALTVIVSQLPKVFGFSTDAAGLVDEASAFVRGLADGRDRRRGTGDRDRFDRHRDGRAPAGAGRAVGARRGRPRHARRVPVRSPGHGRRGGAAAARAALVRPAGRPVGRSPVARGRGRVDRAGRVRRHQRALAYLCGEAGGRCRSEPRDDGARRGEPGDGSVPGVPDLRQRIAHARGRVRRGQDAADRRRRGGRDRPHAAVRADAAPQPAAGDPRRHRDRGRDEPHRGSQGATPLPVSVPPSSGSRSPASSASRSSA